MKTSHAICLGFVSASLLAIAVNALKKNPEPVAAAGASAAAAPSPAPVMAPIPTLPPPPQPEPMKPAELPTKVADRTGEQEREAQRNAEARVRAALEQVQLETRVQALDTLQGNEAITYAAALDVPDNTVKLLYPGYVEAGLKLQSMQQSEGMGQKHPAVVAQTQVISHLRDDLETSVASLKETLRTQLEKSRTVLKEGATNLGK